MVRKVIVSVGVASIATLTSARAGGNGPYQYGGYDLNYAQVGAGIRGNRGVTRYSSALPLNAGDPTKGGQVAPPSVKKEPYNPPASSKKQYVAPTSKKQQYVAPTSKKEPVSSPPTKKAPATPPSNAQIPIAAPQQFVEPQLIEVVQTPLVETVQTPLVETVHTPLKVETVQTPLSDTLNPSTIVGSISAIPTDYVNTLEQPLEIQAPTDLSYLSTGSYNVQEPSSNVVFDSQMNNPATFIQPTEIIYTSASQTTTVSGSDYQPTEITPIWQPSAISQPEIYQSSQSTLPTSYQVPFAINQNINSIPTAPRFDAQPSSELYPTTVGSPASTAPIAQPISSQPTSSQPISSQPTSSQPTSSQPTSSQPTSSQPSAPIPLAVPSNGQVREAANTVPDSERSPRRDAGSTSTSPTELPRGSILLRGEDGNLIVTEHGDRLVVNNGLVEVERIVPGRPDVSLLKTDSGDYVFNENSVPLVFEKGVGIRARKDTDKVKNVKKIAPTNPTLTTPANSGGSTSNSATAGTRSSVPSGSIVLGEGGRVARNGSAVAPASIGVTDLTLRSETGDAIVTHDGKSLIFDGSKITLKNEKPSAKLSPLRTTAGAPVISENGKALIWEDGKGVREVRDTDRNLPNFTNVTSDLQANRDTRLLRINQSAGVSANTSPGGYRRRLLEERI